MRYPAPTEQIRLRRDKAGIRKLPHNASPKIVKHVARGGPHFGVQKVDLKMGPFSLSYCNKSRNPILGSTFWTPKWGPLLATCLTTEGHASCGHFRIPAVSILNRICFVGARYLMTSKAAGKSCVSAFVSAQRRPFMGAPVFAANFGPHFGVCFRKLL